MLLDRKCQSRETDGDIFVSRPAAPLGRDTWEGADENGRATAGSLFTIRNDKSSGESLGAPQCSLQSQALGFHGTCVRRRSSLVIASWSVDSGHRWKHGVPGCPSMPGSNHCIREPSSSELGPKRKATLLHLQWHLGAPPISRGQLPVPNSIAPPRSNLLILTWSLPLAGADADAAKKKKKRYAGNKTAMAPIWTGLFVSNCFRLETQSRTPPGAQRGGT